MRNAKCHADGGLGSGLSIAANGFIRPRGRKIATNQRITSAVPRAACRRSQSPMPSKVKNPMANRPLSSPDAMSMLPCTSGQMHAKESASNVHRRTGELVVGSSVIAAYRNRERRVSRVFAVVRHALRRWALAGLSGSCAVHAPGRAAGLSHGGVQPPFGVGDWPTTRKDAGAASFLNGVARAARGGDARMPVPIRGRGHAWRGRAGCACRRR